MDRKELLRKKYAYIKENYPHLSGAELRKRSFWGWDRLYKDLAITQPKKLKSISLRQDYSQREIEKSKKTLEYLELLKKARIKNENTGEMLPQFDAKTRQALIKASQPYKNKNITGLKYNKKYTHDLWCEWSDKNNKKSFSPKVLAFIHTLNLKKNLDINNPYAFTYTYYRLVMGFSHRKTNKLIEPDPLSREGVIYTRVGA